MQFPPELFATMLFRSATLNEDSLKIQVPLLPLRVLLLMVKLPKVPMTQLPIAALFPLKVLLLTFTVPLPKLKMPPPTRNNASFPLKVLLLTITVPVPEL